MYNKEKYEKINNILLPLKEICKKDINLFWDLANTDDFRIYF
jgi:hypothetical protein